MTEAMMVDQSNTMTTGEFSFFLIFYKNSIIFLKTSILLIKKLGFVFFPFLLRVAEEHSPIV